MPARRIRGPLMLMTFSIVIALALNVGFTLWAVGYHSGQACSELHILANTKGAITPYDQGIRRAYRHLYALRCT
jgi:hypothetical protein